MKIRIGAIVCLLAAITVPGPTGADAARPYVYVTRSKTVRAGLNRVSLKATCPRRTKVVSGGVEIVAGLNLGNVVASFPFDDRDRRRTPDDGWVGIVNNKSGGSVTMRTHAVCTRVLSIQYVKGPVGSLTGSSLGGGSVACPAGMQLTGGGASVSGKSPLQQLMSTFPSDGGDPLAVPDDVWTVLISNRSGVDISFRAFAICTPAGGLAYISANQAVPVFTEGTATASCVAAGPLVGGGADLLGSGSDHQLQATIPVEVGAADGLRDAWRVDTSNGSATVAGEIDLIAICDTP
jgi:hypothetical protein